jgi:hypothetical protein
MREGKNMGIMTTFKKPTLESPQEGGFCGVGRVANPPNLANPAQQFWMAVGGRSREGVSLPDAAWHALVSTTILASHASGRSILEGSTPLLSPLIRSTMLLCERHVTLPASILIHYHFYCH